MRAVNLNDGGSPSHGVCQLKEATARLMGFKGSKKALINPEVNVYYSGKYLRYQLDRYAGDTGKAIAAYNAGTCRYNQRGQTKNRKYVKKVLRAWAQNK